MTHVDKMSRVTRSSPILFFFYPFVALEENIYVLTDEHNVAKEHRPCSIS